MLFYSKVFADHITFSPPDEAFVLYHSHQNTNFTSVFVQDGCPNSRNLMATVYSSDLPSSRRVFEEVPLHCAVKVRIITEKVVIVRPYVDFLAVVDESLSRHVGGICVHAQITSSTSATGEFCVKTTRTNFSTDKLLIIKSPIFDQLTSFFISLTGTEIIELKVEWPSIRGNTVKIVSELGKCYLNRHDDQRTSCVIRIPVPFSWFPIDQNKTSILSVSYTVSEKCDQNFHDLPQHLIEINSKMAKQKVDWLANATDTSVTLRSTASQAFSQKSMQTLFLHVKSWANETQPMEIRLWVDSRMSIETVYPTNSDWTIRVSSASRPFFYTSLICTPKEGMAEFNDNIVAILIKMVSSTYAIKDDVVLHWHVIFGPKSPDPPPDDHKVATKFNVIADEVAAVVIVPKRKELINLAVISGLQVTSSLRIFTVSIGARAEDVTSQSHCISSDANIIKVSPTCSSVYLDGSESNGSSDAQVYAHFLRYTTVFSFRVWYPKLPLKIWTSTSSLSTIKNWKVGFWRDLPLGGGIKRSRAARQFACVNRFQNGHVCILQIYSKLLNKYFQVKVLASLWIEDQKTGDQLYLSSHKSILLDVTNIVHNTLQISNRTVANVKFHEGRAVMIGENVGLANAFSKYEISRLIVRNAKKSLDLVTENVSVRNEEVTTTGLSARPICDTNFRILPILFSPAFFKIEITHSKALTKLYQQCLIFASVSYSDGTWEPLNDLDASYFEMSAHSDNERALVVSHHASKVHVLAIDEHWRLPSVEIALQSSAQCASTINGASPASLAVTILNVPITINTSVPSINDLDASSSTPEPPETLPSVPMHVFLLTILGLVILFILISCVRRSAAFKGYEQLVVPFFSRLSSSSGSHSRQEETNEWVWLSQPQAPSSTISKSSKQKSSGYSGNKSTAERQSSNGDDPSRTSISYHGSEISVFIAPSQANVVVNQSSRHPRYTLVDSNSDHNLARIGPKEERWTTGGHDQFHTWTWKQRDGRMEAPIRESIA
ncbi:Protein CBG09839 [Caenorhabditis briggsae]|uniref:Protein CBG09839 n=1 Tax=Caenorhabditis briggsae TaxID=6238 RepID=A8X9S1_CAEBR|nr:Protein CBG09839 [Caenorhabditis briggsae]CAP29386.2 Protein CBG09839 [Caenorhabditis briggsae]